jgi:hypothetical protein
MRSSKASLGYIVSPCLRRKEKGREEEKEGGKKGGREG